MSIAKSIHWPLDVDGYLLQRELEEGCCTVSLNRRKCGIDSIVLARWCWKVYSSLIAWREILVLHILPLKRCLRSSHKSQVQHCEILKLLAELYLVELLHVKFVLNEKQVLKIKNENVSSFTSMLVEIVSGFSTRWFKRYITLLLKERRHFTGIWAYQVHVLCPHLNNKLDTEPPLSFEWTFKIYLFIYLFCWITAL